MQQNIDAALQAAEGLASHEQYAEAVQFLESQPPSVRDVAAVQKVLADLRQASDNELAALKSLGNAYAALDRRDSSAGILQNPAGNVASSLLGKIVPIFAARRKSAADRQLSTAIDQARAAIETGDRKQAASILESVMGFSPFASSELNAEWQSLSKKTSKGKVFRKSG